MPILSSCSSSGNHNTNNDNNNSNNKYDDDYKNDSSGHGSRVDIKGPASDYAHSSLDAIPILHLFPSFMSSSTSYSHISGSQRVRSLNTNTDDEDSDLEMLERNAFGNRRIFLTKLEEQQLTAECRLLSTLQELLKGKSTFQRFISDRHSNYETGKKSGSGSGCGRRECSAIGRKLINQLCRRLLFHVEESENKDANENKKESNLPIWIPLDRHRQDTLYDRKCCFSMVKIKISVT